MRWVLAVVCVCGVARLAAVAQSVETWTEVDLAANWKRASFTVPAVIRLDTQLANPQLAATGVLVDLALSHHFTLTPGYLFAELPQSSTQVHVPLLAGSVGWQAGRFSFADRNRVEKLVGYGSAPVRYRNRILVDRPFGVSHRWHAFATDEIFWNISNATWNQNRLQAGGGLRLHRNAFFDMYYLQRNASGGSATTRVVGTTLRILLKPARGEALKLPQKAGSDGCYFADGDVAGGNEALHSGSF
jgi:hypothetical protein